MMALELKNRALPTSKHGAWGRMESTSGPSQQTQRKRKTAKASLPRTQHSELLHPYSETLPVATVGTPARPSPSPSGLWAACLWACPALQGAFAIREEACRWHSITELLRKSRIINLILYLETWMAHQGSKQHKTQRTKMKGNKSKLIRKFDTGIVTNSQLSVPMSGLRHKNPQNYLQLVLNVFWFLL